jgi:hypothetical protein
MIRTSVIVIIVAVCLTIVLAHVSNAEGGPANDFAKQREKVNEQLATARKKGVGTKPYESALLSIEHDFETGAAKDQVMKRLNLLSGSLDNQLRELAALKMGASSGAVSPAQAKEWGQYTPYMTAKQDRKTLAATNRSKITQNDGDVQGKQKWRDKRSKNLPIVRCSKT